MSVKQEVVKLINESGTKLLEAHTLAQKSNPLVQDLPVFQELLGIQKKLGEIMLAVNKLRGL